MDRIDRHIEVPAVPMDVLRDNSEKQAIGSAEVQERVEAARSRQLKRHGKANYKLNTREIDKACQLDEADHKLLTQASDRLGLSARAYHRILKVARTIADLDDSENIQTSHLTEAISYRRLDRELG